MSDYRPPDGKRLAVESPPDDSGADVYAFFQRAARSRTLDASRVAAAPGIVHMQIAGSGLGQEPIEQF